MTVILSGWLGDNNEQVGLFGLGFVASAAAVSVSANIFPGIDVGAAFSTVLGASPSITLGVDVGASLVIREGPHTPLFASGFDASSHFAVWHGDAAGGAANANLVTGRNGFGASPILFGGADINALYAQPSAPFNVVGMAITDSVLDEGVMTFNGTSGSTLNIALAHIGDGRWKVTMSSNAGTATLPVTMHTTLNGEPGYVYSIGDFCYVEMAALPTEMITFVDLTHSSVLIGCDVYLRVNDNLVWHGFLSNGPTTMLNTAIPSIGFTRFSLTSEWTVYDDVYANTFSNPATDFIGDCLANPDDLTVTVEYSAPAMTQVVEELTQQLVADPHITQVVQEATGILVSDPRFTQVVMEVAYKRQLGYIRTLYQAGSFMTSA